jgi:hypothetical protein
MSSPPSARPIADAFGDGRAAGQIAARIEMLA